jgi:hypothetical protein
MSTATVAVTGVSFLNQDCVHLPGQMVFKTYAGDPDLFDRGQPRRRSQSQSATANSLPAIQPAISINKFRSDAGKMPANRMYGCVPLARAPQKENQCQES